MKKTLFTKQSTISTLNSEVNSVARAYCGCTSCTCKKTSLKSSTKSSLASVKMVSANV